jgi:hypothetical protein
MMSRLYFDYFCSKFFWKVRERRNRDVKEGWEILKIRNGESRRTTCENGPTKKWVPPIKSNSQKGLHIK